MAPSRDESSRIALSVPERSGLTALARLLHPMLTATDEEALLRHFAEATVEVLGYDSVEIHIEGATGLAEILTGSGSPGGGIPAAEIEIPIRHGDHQLGRLRARGATCPSGPDERLSALAALLADLLEHRRAVDALRRDLRDARRALASALSEARTKDHFLSAMSHEIRTPLTSIRSLSEVLLTAEEDRETMRDYLSIIHEESLRLTRLTTDLLDLNRIRAGRMNWDFLLADPGEALEAAVRSVSSLAAGRGVTLDAAHPSPLPEILFDRDRLVQVLVNLLDNAVKFSPVGGRVTLRVEPRNGGVRFSVRDHGPGIPPGERERIFERFRQVPGGENASTGTGLGLAICREILQAHGGRIRVEDAEGGGALFTFDLV